MNLKSLILVMVFISTPLAPAPASALTAQQFARICESSDGDCSKHPIVQAYVGGALDLIAVLDEETNYLGKVYCKPAREIFDLPDIIRYMNAQQAEYTDKNVMLVFIRYFEEHGDCN